MNYKLISLLIIFLFLFLPIINTISGLETKISYVDDNLCYGFIIPINSSQNNNMQINISQCLNELLRNNAKIFWIASNISVKSKEINKDKNPELIDFEKGSFIFSFSGNSLKDGKNVNILYTYNLDKKIKIYNLLEPIENINAYILNKPKIAYHCGESVYPGMYLEILKESGFYDYDFIDWGEIHNKLNNEDFNVFIWAGGGTNILSVLSGQLRVRDIETLRKFVANGGGYLGSCYGGYEITTKLRFPLNWLKVYLPKMKTLFSPSFSNRFSLRALPGYGNILVNITNFDIPVSYGLPSIIKSYYGGGPKFLGPEGKTKTFGIIKDICYDKYDPQNGLMPSFDVPEKIIDSWISSSIDKPVWITNNFGDGRVVAFGDHPEHLGIKFMQEFCPVRIIINAAFYSCADGPFDLKVDKDYVLSEIEVKCNGPYEGKILEEINFSGNLFNASFSNTTIWSFGDGEFSTDLFTSHSYKKDGNYSIVLTAIDEEDNIDVDVSTCLIPEKLSVFVRPLKTYNGTIIHFYPNIAGGIGPYNCYWDFCNGSIVNKYDFTKVFYETGIYEGKLTVFDKYNENVTVPFIVVVNNKTNPFIANLSCNYSKTYIENIVTFEINTTIPDDYTFNISFGDEEFFETNKLNSARLMVNHSYSNLGLYYVVITVKNPNGFMFYDINYIKIDNLGPPDKPTITGPAEIRTGKNFELNFNTKDPDDDKFWYQMDFFTGVFYGNSSILYDSNDTFLWLSLIKRPGEHKLRVRAIDENGYKSQWSDTFVITAYERFKILSRLKELFIK